LKATAMLLATVSDQTLFSNCSTD